MSCNGYPEFYMLVPVLDPAHVVIQFLGIPIPRAVIEIDAEKAFKRLYVCSELCWDGVLFPYGFN
jgi:hypothetical protein